MGIKENPYKIKNQHVTKKEWIIGLFNECYTLKYLNDEGTVIVEEIVQPGMYIRGTVGANNKYFIIKKSINVVCYVPLTTVTLFYRHVEETITTETSIVDTPI